MYQLGIIVPFAEVDDEMVDLFHQEELRATFVHDIEEGGSLHQFDGLLIHEGSQMSIDRLCGLILSIKQQFGAFIWIVSTQASTINHQIYLKLGVDGIFEEQSFPKEAILHVKNALTRWNSVHQKVGTRGKEIQTKGIQLLPNKLSMVINKQDGQQQEINLTKMEYQLVSLLYGKPGEVFTYEEIYETIWNIPYEENAYRIANLIFHIREKLIKGSISPTFITTVRSKGYLLKT